MNTRVWTKWIGLAVLAGVLLTGCDQPGQQVQGEVRVTSNPDGASIYMGEKLVGITPCTVTEVALGNHLLVAKKKGFQDARETVTLLGGQDLVGVDFTLDAERGLALIHSDPPGATVVIDGVNFGVTPLLLADHVLGEHRVSFSLEGYLPMEKILKMEDRVPVRLQSKLIANTASVTFNSTPPGAYVNINGVRRGQTPCVVANAPTGLVELEVERSGYYAYEEKVRLQPGEEVTITADLKAIPGGLRITSVPPGGSVYVDNQLKGTAPVEITGLEPGDYRVRVSLRGFEDDSRTLTVENGGENSEEFRLVKNSGILQLVTRPSGAKVFIDGESVGTTESKGTDSISQALQVDLLSQGRHTLQITLKGYRDVKKSFNVSADQATVLNVSMERLFIPDTMVRTGLGADQAFTGVLLRTNPDGSVQLETSPGVINTFERGEYIAIEPLKKPELPLNR